MIFLRLELGQKRIPHIKLDFYSMTIQDTTTVGHHLVQFWQNIINWPTLNKLNLNWTTRVGLRNKIEIVCIKGLGTSQQPNFEPSFDV